MALKYANSSDQSLRLKLVKLSADRVFTGSDYVVSDTDKAVSDNALIRTLAADINKDGYRQWTKDQNRQTDDETRITRPKCLPHIN